MQQKRERGVNICSISDESVFDSSDTCKAVLKDLESSARHQGLGDVL